MAVLKPMLVGGAFLGIVYLLLDPTWDNPTYTLKGGPSLLRTSFGIPLGGATLDRYRDWSRKPDHFGAFAASEFGDFGYVSEYNDPALAEAAALAYCDNPDCRVIAWSIPAAPPEDGVIRVSRASGEAFEEYLTYSGAKAFAIHGSGAGGSWVRARTLFGAKQGAIRECKLRIAGWENPPPDVADTCRVVHVSRR
jgi:hypothetical protein